MVINSQEYPHLPIYRCFKRMKQPCPVDGAGVGFAHPTALGLEPLPQRLTDVDQNFKLVSPPDYRNPFRHTEGIKKR